MAFLVAPNAWNRIVLGSGVAITTLLDAERNECKDNARPLDLALRREGRTPLIGLDVSGRSQRLDVFIELVDGDPVRQAFYAGTAGRGLTLPRVVVLREGMHAMPSCIEIPFPGTDDSDCRRLLLPGEYRLVVESKVGGRVHTRAETSFTVARPRADLAGLHQRNRHGHVETTRTEMDGSERVLAAAPAGESYDVAKVYANWAPDLLSRWSQASVGSFSGHSNPLGLWLYNGDGGRPTAATTSWLENRLGHDGSDSNHTYSIPLDGSLDNMLFVLLNGCRGGNEVMGVQEQLRVASEYTTGHTISGVLDDATRVSLRVWQRLFDLPVTMDADADTLAHMRIDPTGLDQATVMQTVQRHLRDRGRAYDCGEVDGKWGPNTASGISAFQTDAGLTVNGLPDKPTRDQLKIGERVQSGVNTAEAFVNAGSDMSIGFVKSVPFDTATKWQVRFYNQLGLGLSFVDAAEAVMLGLRPQERTDMEYNFYARDGVMGDEEGLFPARYGRSV